MPICVKINVKTMMLVLMSDLCSVVGKSGEFFWLDFSLQKKKLKGWLKTAETATNLSYCLPNVPKLRYSWEFGKYFTSEASSKQSSELCGFSKPAAWNWHWLKLTGRAPKLDGHNAGLYWLAVVSSLFQSGTQSSKCPLCRHVLTGLQHKQNTMCSECIVNNSD